MRRRRVHPVVRGVLVPMLGFVVLIAVSAATGSVWHGTWIKVISVAAWPVWFGICVLLWAGL